MRKIRCIKILSNLLSNSKLSGSQPVEVPWQKRHIRLEFCFKQYLNVFIINMTDSLLFIDVSECISATCNKYAVKKIMETLSSIYFKN